MRLTIKLYRCNHKKCSDCEQAERVLIELADDKLVSFPIHDKEHHGKPMVACTRSFSHKTKRVKKQGFEPPRVTIEDKEKTTIFLGANDITINLPEFIRNLSKSPPA